MRLNECMVKKTVMRRKDPAAVALGRKGGRARVKNQTPEERIESARRAAEARWAQQKRVIEDSLREIREGTEALLRAEDARTNKGKKKPTAADKP